MVHTKLFKSNQSQAVRLSKSVAFPSDVKEVEVVVIGNSRIITPVNQCWDNWFDSETTSSEFMTSREQPLAQERELFND